MDALILTLSGILWSLIISNCPLTWFSQLVDNFLNYSFTLETAHWEVSETAHLDLSKNKIPPTSSLTLSIKLQIKLSFFLLALANVDICGLKDHLWLLLIASCLEYWFPQKFCANKQIVYPPFFILRTVFQKTWILLMTLVLPNSESQDILFNDFCL